MFLLNDVLNTSVRSGFQFTFFEESKLPMFIPREEDFSNFDFYSQKNTKYFDEVFAVDRDLKNTLDTITGKEYKTSLYSFFVYKYHEGIMFRHLPDLSTIQGPKLKKIFGEKTLSPGFTLLITDNKVNGVIATYKYLEYLDELKLFLNILLVKPKFSINPLKSKVKNFYLTKELTLKLDTKFLHGLIAVPEFINNMDFYEKLSALQNQYPIIIPISPDNLEKFLDRRFFTNKIIQLDQKEKLYIPNKQGNIPTRVYIQKILMAIKRGNNASI